MMELDTSNFDAEIKQGVTLVDFWAPWCGPCMMQGPILENVAKQVGNKVKIGKLNIDNAPSVANEFGIVSIPTLILFKDGAQVQRFVGVRQEEELIAEIDAAQ